MEIKGKKAIEWPQTLVYVLLCAILLVIGVNEILFLSESVDVSLDFNVRNLEYNLISSRVINSADCLAYEESYLTSRGVTNHLVHAGLIDESKFSKLRLQRCVKDETLAIWITDFEGNNLLSEPNITTKTPERQKWVEDYYFVKVRNSDGSFSDALLRIKLWF